MDSLSYKLDKVQYTNQVGSYQIFPGFGQVMTINISGSLPTGKFNLYQSDFTFTGNTVALGRVFVQNPLTGLKAPLSVGNRLSNLSPTYEIYDAAGGELVQTNIRYLNGGGTLRVSLTILNNTGATINLITQTLKLYIDLYLPPFDLSP